MNLLEFSIPEWFFVALSFAILVIALRQLFWKPVGKILDERRAIVDKSLADAEEAHAEKKRLAAYRAEFLADTDRQAAEISNDARIKASREYERIVSEAEDYAHTIIVSAQERAEREREDMMAAALKEIKASALAVTYALLEAEMSPEKNERLINAVLAQRGIEV